MTRKNILFIARWYPDKHDPMLGLFVRAHAQCVNLYNDVTVLYITTDKTLFKGEIEVITSDFEGIKEVRIYFGKSRFGLINLYNYVRFYLRGTNVAIDQSGKFDLTHAHILSRTAIPAIWLKITQRIPYIITEHWSRYLPINLKSGSYNGFFRRLFTKFAVGSASAVTTVTQNLAEAMQALNLKNTYFITPNVADTGLFHPAPTETKNEIKKLVHVSCFDEPAKNIKGIINVVNKLSEQRNDFELEIIGTGIDYDEVYNYALKTDLVGTKIHFTGLLTGEKLAGKMREADLMVMFSNYENLPCTIVESICCGVPVISSNVGGIDEHIFSENGILVEKGNEQQLIDGISFFLDGGLIVNKDDLRNYGLKHFSMEAIGLKFNDIYLNISK